jgi:hypothetical protein
MWKSRSLLSRRSSKLGRVFVAVGFLLVTFMATARLHAQDPKCTVVCGTQQMACGDALNSLCGKFVGSVEITARNPQDPEQLIPISTIDLALVLDDFGSGSTDWRGYVYGPQSFVYPIVKPPDRGPDVGGSHNNRTCTDETPCELNSETFTTPVSGTNTERGFVLTVTTIEYDDDASLQKPRTLVGGYLERITGYTPGRPIEVRGTFRITRSLPVAERP